MRINKLLCYPALLFLSVSAQAQSNGVLNYAPSPFDPIAVPMSSLLLLPLSIGILVMAYFMLRKRAGQQVLGLLALTVGLGLLTVSSLQIQRATAQAAIELSNPEGGSVEIPRTSAVYVNTSGVRLDIESVEPPPSCSNNSPADECTPGLRLLDGQSCSTDFDCPQPQSISFTSTPPADAVVNGGPYEVTATASSGLPVSFSTTSAACSVTGSTVSFDAEGMCTINADQTGNDEFLPAAQTQQTFTIAAPRITFVPAAPICSFGSPPSACNAQPSTEFSISPACDASGWTVTVDWDQNADGTIDQQDVGTQVSPIGNYIVQGAYAFGEHRFRVSAEDACGTNLEADIPFEIIDCKAPSPICINGLTVTLMPGQEPATGMAAIWASDFVASPVDDCSPPVEYSINRSGEDENRSQTGLQFSCEDEGNVLVEIHGWDQVDNNDFCETFVIVQDSLDVCPP